MIIALSDTEIIAERTAKSNFIMEITLAYVVELINYEGKNRKAFKGNL